MSNSGSISIDDLQRKGPLGVVTACKKEIFGLKGSLLMTLSERAWLRWKEALRLTLKELEGVIRRNKRNDHL